MLRYKTHSVLIFLVFFIIYSRSALAEEFNSTSSTVNSCASNFLNIEIQNTPLAAATKTQPITTIPDFVEQGGIKAAGRCDVSNFTVAVRNEGHLRAIYRNSPSGEAQNFIPDNRLDPAPEQDKAYALHLDCENNESGCAIRLQQELNDKKNYIDNVISTIKILSKIQYKRTGKPVKILIFAHGGLVSHQSAILSAEALAPIMLHDGYIPVFLVWNSDFPVSYYNRLCCVRDGKAQEPAGIETPIFITERALEDVVSSVASSLENYGRQAMRFRRSSMTNHADYHLNTEEIERDQIYCSGKCRIIYPPFTDNLNFDSQNRFKKYSKHIAMLPFRFTATLIGAEIGASSWKNMVRRTRLSFNNLSNSTCTSEYLEYLIERSINKCPSGGFSIFFDALKESLQVDGNTQNFIVDDKKIPIEIDIYGHSMGAIVVNQALSSYPTLPWKKVVYMASAATIRDFKTTAAPVLIREKIPFYNLSLHPMNEAREAYAHGFAPQGSLLEWVDEMFEGPRTSDDRTMGKWRNLEASLPGLDKDLLKLITIRVFPVQTNLHERNAEELNYHLQQCSQQDKPIKDGIFQACYPVGHGGFTRFSFWREAFLTGAIASH